MLHCWFSGSMYLHSSTYTCGLQVLPCLQTESIFNTAVALQYMLYGTSWPWKLVFMRSFHVLNLLLTYLSSLFISYVLFCEIDVTQPLFKSFPTESSMHFLRDIERNRIGRVFIVLLHAITKHIFRRFDKKWYQCLIKFIGYNITTVLSIIAWHLIRDHHPVRINP